MKHTFIEIEWMRTQVDAEVLSRLDVYVADTIIVVGTKQKIFWPCIG